MVSLRQALLSCPTGLLHKMAQAYGLRVESTTLRPELVAALTTTIDERAAYPELWDRLDMHEAVAVSIAARSERGVEADTLVRRMAAEAPGGSPGGQLAGALGESPGGQPTDPAPLAAAVARLVERGLLFRTFSTEGPARGTFLVVPDELRGPARDRLAVSSPLAGLARPAPPDAVRHHDLRRDVFELASALRREAWNAASRGIVGRPERGLDQVLTRLRDAASEDDARVRRERWRFLVALGRRGGWLQPGAWPSPVDEQVVGLLAEGGGLAEALWRAYLGTREGRHEATRLPATVEDGLLQSLAEIAPGTWFDARVLAEALAASAAVGGPGSPGPGTAVPPRAPAVALEDLLTGPWSWLGLVDRGRDRDAWSLVGTTPALGLVGGKGAPVSDTEPVSDAEPATCRLQDDLLLIAPPAADLAALYEAEPYLALERSGPERRYRLTAGSVARGCRLGGSVEVLAAVLERLARGMIPASWRTAIEQWTSNTRRVRIAARITLETDGTPDLDRVLATLGGDATGVERLSERHAAVPADALARVIQRLGDAGVPVDLAPELRLDPRRPERAAALGAEGADMVWVLVEALRRLDPGVVEHDPALGALAAALDAITPARARATLERRAAGLAARIADRQSRRPRPTR